MYADYWKNWFGNERPHSVKGSEIIRLSHEWKLPIEYLMDQVFVIHYDVLDEDRSVSFVGGYVEGAPKEHTYIPKYARKIFEKPTSRTVGNVFYFKQDQMRGSDNMVFRVQPRPIKGYRKAFVSRMKHWIHAVNYWTNNGYVDGYSAKIIEIYQPEKNLKSERRHGKERNHSYDYIMIQVPRVYATIMIEDGYFPAVYDNFVMLRQEFPKKWKYNIDPAVAAEMFEKRMKGLEIWLKERTRLVNERKAEEEAERNFERYMSDKRKTGVKPYDYYKYSRQPTIIA